MLNTCPAIVIVAVRDAVELFWATEKLTVPGPVPLAPDVMVTNAALGTPVRGQLPPVGVTVMAPVPPAGVKDWLGGAIAYAHPAAVIVNT